MADDRTPLPVGVWTEVVGTAPSTASEIVNTGPVTILVSYSPTAPTQAIDGFELAPGAGDRRTANLTKIYARPLNPDKAGEIYALAA